MDIFFYEAFEEEEASLRRHLGRGLNFEMSDKTIQESPHRTPPARLISIRTQSIIPVDWAKSIDGVLSRSTGYDHLRAYLDTIAAPLPCGYLEEYATRAVAEHAVAVLTSLFRRMPAQVRQMASFDRNGLTGSEFGGKNLLVVGVGRIGSEIVRLGQGIGMNVKGVDIVRRHPGVQYVARDEGLAWADAVVCAMNLTPENRGYFSAPVLKKAKPGIIFVNIARGEHAVTRDLVQLLEQRHLAGVGLDVFEAEPDVASSFRNPSGHRSEAAELVRTLGAYPNVVLTPHNAFNTVEAVERKSEMTARQIRHFLQHKRFLWSL